MSIIATNSITITDLLDNLSIVLLNENQSVACGSSRAASAAQNFTIPFAAYLGSDRIGAIASYSTLPGGVTLGSNTAATINADGTLVFNIANGANLGGTTPAFDAGFITITITPTGYSGVVKRFNWTKTVAGATGATGNGISGTAVTYQVGTSGTIAPTGTWLASVPSVPAGQYLWTQIVISYTGGGSTTSYAVGLMGAQGPQGTTGNTGPTGNGISSTTVTYQVHTNGTTAPTGTWLTTIPSVPAGQYLWTKVVLSYTAGGSTTSYSVGLMGAQGPQGQQGIQGPQGNTGAQGKGISSTVVTYQASSSGITAPTGTWQATVPTVADNQYLWTRIVINYTSGDPTTSYSVGKMGAQGPQGNTGATGATGVGISSTSVTYQAGGSGTTAPTGTWSATVPTVADNQFLWTKVVINYTSGNPTTSYSVGKMGAQGPQGAKGETGAKGATGDQGPKGDTGVSITGVSEWYLATASSSGVTTSTSGWTEAIQTITATKKYLWNYEIISFSDESSSPTLPVIIGVYGDKGTTGSTGRALTGVTEYYLASSSASGITRPATDGTGGWTTTMQVTTPTNKYLWNYEKLTWSVAPLITYVEPIIIGIHGDKGDTGSQGPQGIQGIQGSAGVNARAISLSTPTQTFTYNSSGTTPSPAGPVTVTATAYNTSGTVYYNFLLNGSSVQNTTSNTYSYTPQASHANMPQLIRIDIREGASTGTILATDTLSMIGVKPGVNGTNGVDGDDGLHAFTVFLTNEAHTFAAATDGVVPDYAGGVSEVRVYYGSTLLTAQDITAATPTVDNKYRVSAIASTSGTVTLTPSIASSQYKITPSAMTTDGAVRTLTIVAQIGGVDYTFTKVLTYAKSKTGTQGATGATGAAGVSITAVDVEYGKSSSATTAPTSWSTAAPTWEAGKYIWSRTKTTYSAGNPTYTNAACITGQAGQTGGTGRGVASIVEQYVVSSSKTVEPSSASFSTARPTWSPGQYIWSRSLITYTSGSPATSTTTPVVSSEWEAVNEIQVGGRNLFILNQSLWRIGSIASSDGTNQTGNSRISTIDFSPMESSQNYYLSIHSEHNVGIFAYDEEDNYLGFLGSPVWQTQSTILQSPAGTAKFRMVLAKKDNTTITLDELENVIIKLERGNKATDWTPAPEDVDAAIAEAQTSATSKSAIYFYATLNDVEYPIDTGSIVFLTSDNTSFRYGGLDELDDHIWTDITNNLVGTALAVASNAYDLAQARAQVFVQESSITPEGAVNGDIWIKTDDNNRPYILVNSQWLLLGQHDLSAIEANIESVVKTIIGGANVFRQPEPPIGAVSTEGDLWFDTNDNNLCYKFVGGTWSEFDFQSVLTYIADAKNELSDPTNIYNLMANYTPFADFIAATVDINGYNVRLGDIESTWSDLTTGLTDLEKIVNGDGEIPSLAEIIEAQKVDAALIALLNQYKVYMAVQGEGAENYIAIRRGIDGSYNSLFEIRITNARISFIYDGQEIAYASGSEFNMNLATINTKMRINATGGYFDLLASNGGLQGIWTSAP